MTRIYRPVSQLELSRDDLAQWAGETDTAVAAAIHAISDAERTPDAIWQDPTQAEWDRVVSAVAEYLKYGDFPAHDDGRYHWGWTAIQFVVCSSPDGFSLHMPDATDADIASGDAPYIVSQAFAR